MEKTTRGAVTTDARVRVVDVLSDDGTRIRAWTNDPDGTIDGPTVVLFNGLGTSPWAWPALLEPGCGVRVVSWNHRGTGGSSRPVDANRVGITEFAEDGLSVMDHFGIDRAVPAADRPRTVDVLSHTAFMLPQAHPDLAARAGTYDVLAGARDMATAAARMQEATYVELRTSHLAQMEQPDVLHQLIVEFLETVA